MHPVQGPKLDESHNHAAYYSEDEARLWYQLLKEEGRAITWQLLKEGLHVRFDPTECADFFGDLTKLRQNTTVRDYQGHFEKLLARAGRLTPAQQVGCFISGLKKSIRVEV
uniref:Retrotransposon gag domain-containing protein n=1 Tax=Davidia involucrata TaxID=16924 RepID=A0A5B6ZWP3_DAVIN